MRKVLKPEEDAYGQELWAHYSGKESIEIVERDDGYIEASDHVPYSFSSYEEWAPYEKKAMEYVKGRALDVGCGCGRHSLHLQGKGLDVVGIDNLPLAIEVCRLRGLKKAVEMAFDDVDFELDSFGTLTTWHWGLGGTSSLHP